MSAEIPLRARDGSIRAVALVDDEDFVALDRFRWALLNGRYACSGLGKRGPKVLMHRYILGLQAGDKREVDHISGDTLDNRRRNLRIVTKAEQQQNLASHRGATSRHRNVHWDAERQQWLAQATLAGKHHFIGRYSTEEAAAEAAADFRRKHMTHAVDR